MGKKTTELSRSSIFAVRPEYTAHPNRQAGGPYLYAFYVVDIDKGRVLRSFGFDIPPQQIRLDEDAAADISAAQDGGYWSDERGQYFKMLTLSGTFGYRPTPQQKRINEDPILTNASADQVSLAVSSLRREQVVTGISSSENTGNTRFVDLTNIIRYYWDRKKTRTNAGSVIFIWADWKMGEVYIAQPLRMSRERNAPANRFKTVYNLTLRLLEPLDIITPFDFYSSPNSEGGGLSYEESKREAVKQLTAAYELVEGTISSAIDFGFSVKKTIFEPMAEFVLNGILAIQDEIKTNGGNFSVSTFLFKNVQRMALDAAVELGNSVGFFDAYYSYLKIRREICNIFVALTSSYGADEVNSVARSMGSKYRKWDTDAAVDSSLEPNGRVIEGDLGSNTSLGSRAIPGGSYTMRLPARTTVKQFAAETLGSVGKWKDLVLLNRLVPPYFSPRGDGITVLRPGDPIKIPAIPEQEGDENKVYSTSTDAQGSDAYRYGRDLRMDTNTQDLMVNDTGDLDVVEGLDNLSQAMYIKILTKPGDLKVHEWFGFSAEPGEGISIDLLAKYQFELKRTLLSDTRVDKINSLSMRVAGDVLRIKASMTPKDQDNNLELFFSSRL